MPTKLPRTQVTHSADIQYALRVAVECWPGEPESVLLTRLIVEGARTVEGRTLAERGEHHERVAALAGRYTDLYPANYLAALRSEWPE